MKIERIEAYRLKLPLNKPYHTALGDIHCFDTTVVLASGDGRTGAGETTPLPGYCWETPDGAWAFINEFAGKLAGKGAEEAKRILEEHVKDSPFAVTALMTAIENMEGLDLLEPPQERMEVELIGILNETTKEGIEKAIPAMLDAGFCTLKFKVGFDVREDIEKVSFIQKLISGRARLRLDANQQYSLEDARRFISSVDPAVIELLEQPLATDNWRGMEQLANESPIPLMLDEAIYSEKDIERAGELGCAGYIKLKLMKCGGARHFAQQIQRTRELGMRIIIGNGVASDISCLQEALIHSRLGLDTAGEMHGFLKPAETYMEPGLVFENGRIVLDPARRPSIDGEKLSLLAMEKGAWSM